MISFLVLVWLNLPAQKKAATNLETGLKIGHGIGLKAFEAEPVKDSEYYTHTSFSSAFPKMTTLEASANLIFPNNVLMNIVLGCGKRELGYAINYSFQYEHRKHIPFMPIPLPLLSRNFLSIGLLIGKAFRISTNEQIRITAGPKFLFNTANTITTNYSTAIRNLSTNEVDLLITVIPFQNLPKVSTLFSFQLEYRLKSFKHIDVSLFTEGWIGVTGNSSVTVNKVTVEGYGTIHSYEPNAVYRERLLSCNVGLAFMFKPSKKAQEK